MKVSYASDLHLEYGEIDLQNNLNADVLILAGDIVIADEIKRYPFYEFREKIGSSVQNRAETYRKFFSDVASRWKHVIVISGNHESYEGVFNDTHKIMASNLIFLGDNIHYLQNRIVELDGVVFAATTLWTDLNRRDEITAFGVNSSMNDYRRIRYVDAGRYRKLRSMDTLAEHVKSMQFLRDVVSSYKDKPIVVVTHHAPTFQSIPDRFRSERIVNGAYASDLSEFILDNTNIKYWVHGHVHDRLMYPVGDHTTVLCNPRGYHGHEKEADGFCLRSFEVSK